MRLINSFRLFFRRRSPGARGRLAYRMLFDVVVPEKPAAGR